MGLALGLSLWLMLDLMLMLDLVLALGLGSLNASLSSLLCLSCSLGELVLALSRAVSLLLTS